MQFAEAKPLENVLSEIVARVRQFTNADGAAIAIRDGDFVVTRATTGGIAPDLGARMSIQGSFTGLCLEKRTMLHCEDSDADARVDATICRQLSTRSFVVVPVEGRKEPQGVLAAFSSAPHAFTRTDIAVLKTAADQIRQALENAPKTDHRSSSPVDVKVEPDKKIQHEDDSPVKARLSALLDTPAALPEKPLPVVASESTTPTAAPPKSTERTAVAATPARIEAKPAPPKKRHEPVALVSLAESIGTPAAAEPAPPQPLDEKLPEGFREQYLGWKGFETSEPSPRFSRKWIAIGAAACVLLVGTVAISMRTPIKLRNNAAAIPNSSSEVHVAEAAIPTTVSQPQISTPVAPAPTPVAKPRPAETTELPSPTKDKITAKQQPALVIDTSSAKPKAPDVPETEAPPQVSIASSNISVLPEMKNVIPGAPKAPTFKQSELEPSELIHKVVPQFPRFTNAAPGTQTVILRAHVLPDGSIGEVQVVQGKSEFGEAAKIAVKQWRYKPARIDGKPVETSVTVTLNFKR